MMKHFSDECEGVVTATQQESDFERRAKKKKRETSWKPLFLPITSSLIQMNWWKTFWSRTCGCSYHLPAASAADKRICWGLFITSRNRCARRVEPGENSAPNAYCWGQRLLWEFSALICICTTCWIYKQQLVVRISWKSSKPSLPMSPHPCLN